MNRSRLLEAMTQMHLVGVRKAYDEIMAALKRGHDLQRTPNLTSSVFSRFRALLSIAAPGRRSGRFRSFCKRL